MFRKLSLLSDNKFYWLSLFFVCVLLEVMALFYQYVLEYYPCVLCIHVRIWVFGMMILSLLALLLRHNRFAMLGSHLLMTGLLVGLGERSYMLLGTERGFVFGSCDMDLGLPTWFALDSWFPFMFKVWEACGYTPVLFFGVTMAETLIVLSVVLLLLSIALLISFFMDKIITNKA